MTDTSVIDSLAAGDQDDSGAGLADLGASVLSGIPAGIAGYGTQGALRMLGVGGDQAASIGDRISNSIQYQPRTEFGKQILGMLGRGMYAAQDSPLAHTIGDPATAALKNAGLSEGDIAGLTGVLGMTVGGPEGRVMDAAESRLVSQGGRVAEEIRPAPFPQYATQYPPSPEPVWKIDKKKIDPATGLKGKPYQSRGDSPETDAFMDAWGQAQDEIDAGSYLPYFNVDARYDAVPHGANGNTLTDTLAKKQVTRDQHVAAVQTQDARDRLNAAYDAGVASGGHDRWYQMGQLQDEYINELGPEEGAKAFRHDFADAMASTTAGQSPTPNLLMAHYGNYLTANNLPRPDASWKFPYPVSGQYMGNNLAGYMRMHERGGMSAVDNPKGYNFSRNLSGDPNPSTIDAQMSDIIAPGNEAPPNLQYGVYENLLAQEAAKRGLAPRDFQDVAWGGKKFMDTKGTFQGMPMIQHVNEAIQRTSRLTGLTPEQVVRRNLIRKMGPIFGVGGAAYGLNLLDQQDNGT